jgi:cysteinyl-tRNA synthetase
VQSLLDERQTAREAEDWPSADELRAQIEKLGFKVIDKSTGQLVKKN